MSSLTVTLPDGSQKAVPAGTNPLEIAQSISPRLANDAIVARVDGALFDLTRPLTEDGKLEILTTKNPDALEVYRHSTAHLLAAAVLELFPETQLGIGPPTKDGFYYDFDRADEIHPDDLEKIEAKMCEIQARNLPYDRKLTEKADGLAKYEDDWMKHELIEERAGDVFTEYTLGPNFIDFCRGPHVPNTEKLKAFKLLSIAGAYWKGSEKNKQLQRIYGTAFFSKKELDEYLARLEEAKKRDHRRLGQGTGTLYRKRTRRCGLAIVAAEGRDSAARTGRIYPGQGTARRISARLHAGRLQKWSSIKDRATGSTITKICSRPWIWRQSRWCCGR